MKRYLYTGGVLALLATGCASNAPTAPVENETPSIKSPAKPVEHSDEAAHDSHESQVHTHSTRLRVMTTPSVLQAGKSATITLQIVDGASGKPVNEYDIAHDKKLHLVLASSDLSWFNHLHPEFIGDGKFRVTTVIPFGGKLRLYADYKPKGKEGEVAVHELQVKGLPALPSVPKLVAGSMQNGWMTTRTGALPEGRTKEMAFDMKYIPYQVALMPMPAKIHDGEDVMLHFRVRAASGKPIENLQPYLGARGHCVILSNDPKIYLHSHPMDGEHKMDGMNAPMKSTPAGGADVMFHTNFPRAGIYKAWAQFRHQNKIITAPFVLKVEAGKTQQASTSASAQAVTIELPDGYKDSTATIKAGQPVALTFFLKEDAGCGNEVVVPEAKWHKTLKVGERATVNFTPKKSGALKFACGMDMMKGSLVVK